MRYRTIVADPPWPYSDKKGPGLKVGVAWNYPTMSIPTLKRLQPPAADEAHLYLWTTNAFMDEAHDIARAWGFAPKTILTWVKTRKNDPSKPSMKAGYYYRGATEHMLFAVRGRLRTSGPCRPTAYMLPREAHSVKPDYFFALCEEQSPGPYLEMFARRRRDGWDVFGNEVQGSITL